MKTFGWLMSLTLWGLGAVDVNFDSTPPGRTPPGWTVAMTHPGAPPNWAIVNDPSAPSPPHVLAQLSIDRDVSRFPLAILSNVNVKDGDVSVKMKPVAGKEDRAGGLVWRYRDPDNYYAVEANALGNRIALYKVEGGRRVPLASQGMPARTFGIEHPVPANQWSAIKVQFRGPLFSVYFNHRRLFQVMDSTFAQSGKVGVSTQADSVTYFDDFRISGK